MSGPGYDAYRKVDVETASQEKLIVMLLTGAMKFAREAKQSMAAGDIGETHTFLVKAQDILSELRSALNMDAGEVAQNLDRVYEYLHHLLVSANVEKRPEPIDECVRHLEGLRATWQEAFDHVAQNEDGATATHNQHGHTIMNVEG